MRTHLSVLALAATLIAAGSAIAEDIDLFLEQPEGSADVPNVLFMLDNSANWGSTLGDYRKKDILHQALAEVVLDPVTIGAMNAGIMTYTPNSSGGMISSAVGPIDSAKQAEFAEKILLPQQWETGIAVAEGEYVIPSLSSGFNGHIYQIASVGESPITGSSEPGWPTDGTSFTDDNEVTYTDLGQLVDVDKTIIDTDIAAIPKSSSAPYALSLHEAYLYYAGSAPLHGIEDGNDYDTTALDGSVYASPSATSCARNFVILIGNGSPDNGENKEAENELTDLDGKLQSDPIGLTPSNYEANWADEYARFMRSADVSSKDDKQGITTFVIDVVDPDEVKTKPDKAERSFLKSIANQGGGRYFQAKSVEEVKVAILEILREIAAVNSAFASTTLPVSVNVRGTNLNQVYMGVFRPDDLALPYWVGNLKLYKLALDPDTESLYLADKNGDPAESPTTGFIVSDAVSYWTSPSTFWDFHLEYDDSDSPDGEIVEKGAVAQNLRDPTSSPADRKLYTCIGCGTGDALSDAGSIFADTNTAITQAALGAADATERNNIINWVRGFDLQNENSNGDATTARPSIHGDVLHSRPAVINYNRNDPADEEDIIAFYGANDGIFRAVYGGKDGETKDGDEIWGFIPEEFFPKLKTLYDNGPAITADGGAKPYFADGNIGVYQDTGGDGVIHTGDKVHLFISMRRGGRLIYALDVSNPVDPKLLWKRDNNDTGWGELGQTWSEPKVSTLNIGGTPTTVLIMGAGYDAAFDDALPRSGAATMGRGILVVDASNGEVIWQAGAEPAGAAHNETVTGMTYPIPSNVTVIDRNRDGFDDRVYVGDTGGQVWKLDISDSVTSNWTVNRLASIADHSVASGDRKFLYAPDVVYADGYDAILIGSGDREHPLDTTVENRFYMFKDTLPDVDWTAITEAEMYNATANLIQEGDTDAETSLLSAARGWFIKLEDPGEKVVTSAVTLSGSTFFNTNAPNSSSDEEVQNSCVSGLGRARNYIVNFEDATATTNLDGVAGLTKSDRSNKVVGGGFPPSPVPVIVEIDGKKYQAVVSGTKVLTPPNVQLERREPVYWYRPGTD
ncbi:pilus assembly protein [Thiohalomonas denitrificans]|uniref:Type IV pilus assembly protein PilY1 n=1 Tax=Thiohalomonas denitrificans TaxID=415747 RepID=A0A1G5PQY2_9GAMM|nr:PilC/PilY family type IV pilus protein [Thiohalomonas denitrificans]SCZ51621.1 type IV pilus assembly protein PilY1 [Thiohalomonas denitrificans]